MSIGQSANQHQAYLMRRIRELEAENEWLKKGKCINGDEADKRILELEAKVEQYKELITAKDDMLLDAHKLESELEEQSRLVGMGAEREAALVAENERLREENERLRAEEPKVVPSDYQTESAEVSVPVDDERDEISKENERLRAQIDEMSGTYTSKQSVIDDAERWRKACELGYIREHYIREIDTAKKQDDEKKL